MYWKNNKYVISSQLIKKHIILSHFDSSNSIFLHPECSPWTFHPSELNLQHPINNFFRKLYWLPYMLSLVSILLQSIFFYILPNLSYFTIIIVFFYCRLHLLYYLTVFFSFWLLDTEDCANNILWFKAYHHHFPSWLSSPYA